MALILTTYALTLLLKGVMVMVNVLVIQGNLKLDRDSYLKLKPDNVRLTSLNRNMTQRRCKNRSDPGFGN